jgi:hypothetical protein
MADIKKAQWRQAALRMVTPYDERHPAYVRQKGMVISYTRTPDSGAWVQAWIWVPREAAQLEIIEGKEGE